MEMETQENKVVEFDGIDFRALFRKLIDNWKVILKWCGVAAVLALIAGFSIPKEYTVTSRMALESSSGGGGGTLSSLAGLAGINLGSLTSSSDMMSPDLYPEVLNSTPFVLELFPKTVSFEDKKGKQEMTYYEFIRDHTHKPWWNKVLHAPSSLLGWFLGLFSRHEKEADAEKPSSLANLASIDPAHLDMEQVGVAEEMRRRIIWSVDKKTSVIRLAVKAQNPDVAEQMCAEVITLLQKYLTDYRTEKARRDLAYYEQLYDEAKADYYQAQQKYANYQDRNQSIISQRGKSDQERLRNEMSLAFSLYNSCAQQVQTGKAKLQLATPVFTVIDPPQYPYFGKPRKITILFLFVFFAAILSCLWILWGHDAIASLRKEDKKEQETVEEDGSQA